ncbi:MAG: ABC transporter substrate-binding protein [Actinomycetales bacterium]
MFKKVSRLSLALVFILFSTTLVSAANASKYPLQVKSGGYVTKLSAKPVRIISLSPSATEILFALNADNQVLAVDDNSNYPARVPRSELSSFTPNVEAIAALNPDLVLLQINATNAKTVRDALTKIDIPVFVEPAARNVNDTYKEIRLIGKIIDKAKAAKKLIADMKSRIKKALVKNKSKSKLTFFHELDSTLYTATSKTFIGSVYKDFGLINIADAASGADSSGYPQLSAEYLIKSNPDLIFLADAQYGESTDSLKARPGWSAISAVKNNRVIALPADIPSRWGPRIVEFYELVGSSIKK